MGLGLELSSMRGFSFQEGFILGFRHWCRLGLGFELGFWLRLKLGSGFMKSFHSRLQNELKFRFECGFPSRLRVGFRF